MRPRLVPLRIYGAVAAVCLASAAVSVCSMIVLHGMGGLETSHVMAIVSVPYVIGTIALSLSGSMRMRPGWNSFLVSSGVGRKEVMLSLHAPALIIHLAASVSFAAASFLFPERICTAVLACACIAIATSILAAAVGIVSYSISGSSLMTDLSGVVAPMVLAMASYILFVDGAPTDICLSLVCLIASLAIATMCLKTSISCFRRLDL
jgi:hypothetical protein